MVQSHAAIACAGLLVARLDVVRSRPRRPAPSPATMRSIESSISRCEMPSLLRRPVRMAASFSRLDRSAPAGRVRGEVRTRCQR